MKGDVKKLKHYNARLTTALNELENLEDYEDMDYTEVRHDLMRVVRVLEGRRELLQKRGRTQ